MVAEEDQVTMAVVLEVEDQVQFILQIITVLVEEDHLT